MNFDINPRLAMSFAALAQLNGRKPGATYLYDMLKELEKWLLKTQGDILAALPDNAMMHHVDIANVLGIAPEALRKRLDRWRAGHGEGWRQNTERRPREPRYLYCIGAVRDLLKEAMNANP